ncbi:MAG: hypothetical protein VW124_20405 [Paracoccaceae bacterium]
MRINILHLGLSEFFDRKSDILYVLCNALSDMGHTTSIGHNKIERSGLNIVIGSDIISGSPEAISTLIDSKCDFAVFEVENFNGKTINYRQNFDLSGYTLLMENAKFCFTPYHYNIPHLSKIINTNQIAYTKWGFHRSMRCPRIQRNNDFLHTIFFYGLIKSDRTAKLQKLSNKFGGGLQIVDQSLPFTMRDYFISKSKLGLSLSYGKIDNFVNPFRLYHMVANGMPVLSDHSEDADGYLHLCNNFEFNIMVEKIESFEIDEKKLKEVCRTEDLIENLKQCF